MIQKTTRINNYGFSLIEMLVTVAIMGVLISGFSAVIINMQKSQSAVAIKQEMSSLINEIQSTAFYKTSCTQGVGTSQTLDTSATATPDGQNFELRVNNGTLVKAGVDLTNYKVKPIVFRLKNAQQVATDPTDNSKLFQANLEAVFESLIPIEGNKNFGGIKNLGILNLKTDTSNRITSCFDLNDLNQLTSNSNDTPYNQGKCDDVIDSGVATPMAQARNAICDELNYPTDIISPTIQCNSTNLQHLQNLLKQGEQYGPNAKTIIKNSTLRGQITARHLSSSSGAVPSVSCYQPLIKLPPSFQNLKNIDECKKLAIAPQGSEFRLSTSILGTDSVTRMGTFSCVRGKFDFIEDPTPSNGDNGMW